MITRNSQVGIPNRTLILTVALARC